MRKHIRLVFLASLLTSSMAAMIEIVDRQSPRSGTRNRIRRNPSDPIPGAATLASAASITNIASEPIPTSTPDNVVLPLLAETPTPSLVETVILIAPSGTVGGSVLITSIPISPSTQIFDPNIPQIASFAETPALSLVETVILIPPSGTVGGSVLITSIPIPHATKPFNFNTPSPDFSQFASLPSMITADPTQQSLSFPPGPFLSLNTLAPSVSPSFAIPTSLPSMFPFTRSKTHTTLHTSLSTTRSSSLSTPAITPASESTISVGVAHATAASIPSQRKGPGNTALLGISISLVVFAFVLGGIALIWLSRRKKRATTSENEVYPEAAYLYDPPMNVKGSGKPPTLPPMAEIGDFRYGAVPGGDGGGGAAAAAAARERSASPEMQNAERQALLGEPAAAFARNTVAGGLRTRRRGYMPAPIEEVNENSQAPDLDDDSNPFTDQHSTEYDGGQYAAGVAQDRISTQGSPEQIGDASNTQASAAGQAWGL